VAREHGGDLRRAERPLLPETVAVARRCVRVRVHRPDPIVTKDDEKTAWDVSSCSSTMCSRVYGSLVGAPAALSPRGFFGNMYSATGNYAYT